MAADGGGVRCPSCQEVVDRETALRSGGRAYLLCWNGHRFGFDGVLVGGSAGTTDGHAIALSERPSAEGAAG